MRLILPPWQYDPGAPATRTDSQPGGRRGRFVWRSSAAGSSTESRVLPLFLPTGYAAPMPDDPDALMPASAEDLADALTFALRFQGRKRIHNAHKIMAGSSSICVMAAIIVGF